MHFGELDGMNSMSSNVIQEIKPSQTIGNTSLAQQNTKIMTDMEPLIVAQNAIGFWHRLEDLNAYLTTDQRATIAALTKQYPITVVCTVLALLILKNQFPEKKSEWEMIQKKAKKWLKLQK